MIYYFSATGNSKWVAETIAKRTSDTATTIVEALQNEKISVKSGEVFGLVFPVYAWNLPEIVTDFLKKVEIDKDAYSYAVCTCAEEAGLVMKALEMRIRVDSAFSVIMPNNYIVVGDVDDKETQHKKITEADRFIDSIALSVNVREKGVFNVNRGKAAAAKTFVGGHFFNKYARGTKAFKTSYRCNGCCYCEIICPMKNIIVADDVPIWSDNCLHCFACLHRCPQKAVDYGKWTEKKGRYQFNFRKYEKGE